MESTLPKLTGFFRVKQEDCAPLRLLFRKTTDLAAHLIREFGAPVGATVMVLLDAYYLCHAVVHTCREQGCHFASTLKRNRSLFKQGWKLETVRYGKNLFRRRRTQTLVSMKPHGQAYYQYLDAGWLPVSTLGPLHKEQPHSEAVIAELE